MANDKDISSSDGSTDTSVGIVVDSTAVDITGGNLAENEEKTTEDLTEEVSSVTVVAVVPSDTPAKLRQQIKRLRNSLSSRKLAYTNALSRREDEWLKQECQFRKEDGVNKKKITGLKSEVRVLKDDRRARVAAVELQSRVKTSAVSKETKTMRRALLKDIRDAKRLTSAGKTALGKSINKMSGLRKKYDDLIDTSKKQADIIKQLKGVNTKTTKALNLANKKVDSQLEAKLDAQKTKAQLALEKEKIGLERDNVKKRKKREVIKLTHKKRVKLHQFKLECAASAAETKSAVKLMDRQDNLAQSAARIKHTKEAHNGQFPNAGGMSTEQFTSVKEVSNVLLLFVCLF